jgi:hypothetical protein
VKLENAFLYPSIVILEIAVYCSKISPKLFEKERKRVDGSVVKLKVGDTQVMLIHSSNTI